MLWRVGESKHDNFRPSPFCFSCEIGHFRKRPTLYLRHPVSSTHRSLKYNNNDSITFKTARRLACYFRIRGNNTHLTAPRDGKRPATNSATYTATAALYARFISALKCASPNRSRWLLNLLKTPRLLPGGLAHSEQAIQDILCYAFIFYACKRLC